ncbi:MAG TPA: hypothetical protein DCZ44_03760 [Flavobacteriaceae bacterium]|nr:hypothetical protein [Flavobacteriaceae bacterium]
MKLKATIALFLLFMGPALFGQKDSTQLQASANIQRFMTLYFESIKHRAMENPELALKALGAAERIQDLTLEQKSAVAYEQGKSYSLLQDYDRAIIAYELAQQHQDYNIAALTNLYDIYHKQGAYQKSLLIVKALTRFDQDYYVDLVKLHIEIGDLDRAEVILDSITDAWRSSLELQSINLELQKRRSESQNNTTAIGFDPMDYRRYNELLANQDIDQALVLLEAIITASDLETKVKAQAIEAFAAQSPDKQYREAFTRLIPQIEALENAETEVALGRYFLDLLDIEKAQKHGNNALKLEPNNKDVMLLMANVDYARGAYSSGLQHAEMSLALYPADPWSYLMVARGYRYSGMLDLAEMQIMSGLEFTLAGSNQYRLLCLEAASLYTDLGREKDAELWFDKAGQ